MIALANIASALVGAGSSYVKKRGGVGSVLSNLKDAFFDGDKKPFKFSNVKPFPKVEPVKSVEPMSSLSLQKSKDWVYKNKNLVIGVLAGIVGLLALITLTFKR